MGLLLALRPVAPPPPLPFPQDLRNEAMRERHWRKIKSATKDFDETSDSFTLDTVFEIKLTEHAGTSPPPLPPRLLALRSCNSAGHVPHPSSSACLLACWPTRLHYTLGCWLAFLLVRSPACLRACLACWLSRC